METHAGTVHGMYDGSIYGSAGCGCTGGRNQFTDGRGSRITGDPGTV